MNGALIRHLGRVPLFFFFLLEMNLDRVLRDTEGAGATRLAALVVELKHAPAGSSRGPSRS